MTLGTLTFIGGYGSGISVYAREADQLTQLGRLDTPDPSYLIADPDRPVLYAVNELEAGTVSSYAVGPGGTLRRLSTQPTGGVEPCHLALHGDHLIAANYGSGSVSVHPVAGDGSLGERTDLVRHHGSGPNPDRQAGPHAHQVHVENDVLTVVDLGLDRLTHYRLDAATGRLTAAGETAAAAGAGPRHIAVHPSGRWYVSCELASTVATFAPADGVLALTGSHPSTAVTVDTAEGNLPSGVELWGGGRFFYVGNRGADTIATFTVGADGDLTPVGEVGSEGTWPRQFTIVDDLMFVVNQRSDSVIAFRLDPATGLPTATGARVTVGGPSCVLPTPWTA